MDTPGQFKPLGGKQSLGLASSTSAAEIARLKQYKLAMESLPTEQGEVRAHACRKADAEMYPNLKKVFDEMGLSY